LVSLLSIVKKILWREQVLPIYFFDPLLLQSQENLALEKKQGQAVEKVDSHFYFPVFYDDTALMCYNILVITFTGG
jgi:hypothetical protein